MSEIKVVLINDDWADGDVNEGRREAPAAFDFDIGRDPPPADDLLMWLKIQGLDEIEFTVDDLLDAMPVEWIAELKRKAEAALRSRELGAATA